MSVAACIFMAVFAAWIMAMMLCEYSTPANYDERDWTDDECK